MDSARSRLGVLALLRPVHLVGDALRWAGALLGSVGRRDGELVDAAQEFTGKQMLEALREATEHEPLVIEIRFPKAK